MIPWGKCLEKISLNVFLNVFLKLKCSDTNKPMGLEKYAFLWGRMGRRRNVSWGVPPNARHLPQGIIEKAFWSVTVT